MAPHHRHLFLLGVAAVSSTAADTNCTLPGWPGIQPSWNHGGVSEVCFCAYAQVDTISWDEFEARCPSWASYVSTNNAEPNKLTQLPSATIAGQVAGDAAADPPHYGSMGDWSVDLGSGFDADCDLSASPTCATRGTHILSIPSTTYVSDLLSSNPRSLASLLRAGEVADVCAMLRDMIRGGVEQSGYARQGGAAADAGAQAQAQAVTSCANEDEDPTEANGCLAQCFHITPDVNYLHLHTTNTAMAMRDGPGNSGLGPDVNASDIARYPPRGAYNVCVCEPASWAAEGRGACPQAAPSDPEYVEQALASLLGNFMAAAGVDGELGSSVCPAELLDEA